MRIETSELIRGKSEERCQCGKRATIWINCVGKNLEDVFLCDTCALHLARILLQDIGHQTIIEKRMILNEAIDLRSL